MSEAKNAVDQPRIEAAVREILLAIGEDPDRDGLQQQLKQARSVALAAPAPVATASGITPATKASEVIKMGRRRRRTASSMEARTASIMPASSLGAGVSRRANSMSQ